MSLATRALLVLVLLPMGSAPARGAQVELVETSTIGQAHPVQLGGGGAVFHATLPPGDADFVSIDLTAGDLVVLALVDPSYGGFGDPRLELYAPGANDGSDPLLVDDDAGPGLLPQLVTVVPQSGTWIVGLRGDAGTGRIGSVPSVQVVVARLPATFEEAAGESNDVVADVLGGASFEAHAPSGVALIRARLAPGDVDRFTVPVGGGRELFASVVEAAGGAFDDPLLLVETLAAVAVASDDDEAPALQAGIATALGPPDPGALTFEVSPVAEQAGLDAGFDYWLVVAAPGRLCDVSADGGVDLGDLQQLLDADAAPASGLGDLADFDGDGRLTVLDARRCSQRCDAFRCQP